MRKYLSVVKPKKGIRHDTFLKKHFIIIIYILYTRAARYIYIYISIDIAMCACAKVTLQDAKWQVRQINSNTSCYNFFAIAKNICIFI